MRPARASTANRLPSAAGSTQRGRDAADTCRVSRLDATTNSSARRGCFSSVRTFRARSNIDGRRRRPAFGFSARLPAGTELQRERLSSRVTAVMGGRGDGVSSSPAPTSQLIPASPCAKAICRCDQAGSAAACFIVKTSMAPARRSRSLEPKRCSSDSANTSQPREFQCVDVGCGAGAYGPALIELGHSWLGLEANAGCLELLAARQFAASPCRIRKRAASHVPIANSTAPSASKCWSTLPSLMLFCGEVAARDSSARSLFSSKHRGHSILQRVAGGAVAPPGSRS